MLLIRLVRLKYTWLVLVFVDYIGLILLVEIMFADLLWGTKVSNKRFLLIPVSNIASTFNSMVFNLIVVGKMIDLTNYVWYYYPL